MNIIEYISIAIAAISLVPLLSLKRRARMDVFVTIYQSIVVIVFLVLFLIGFTNKFDFIRTAEIAFILVASLIFINAHHAFMNGETTIKHWIGWLTSVLLINFIF